VNGIIPGRCRGSGRRSRAGRSSGRAARRPPAARSRRPAIESAEAEGEGSSIQPAVTARSSASAASIDITRFAQGLLLLDVPHAVALLELRPLRRRLDRLVDSRPARPRGRVPWRPRRSRCARGRSVDLLDGQLARLRDAGEEVPGSRFRCTAARCRAMAGSRGRSGRSASVNRVVPTPSVWTPRYFARGLSMVG